MQPSGTLASRHLAQRIGHVDVRVIEDLGLAERRRERQALGKAIDRDDPLGSEQERALDRELADGAAAPDGHGVARLDLAVLGRHVAGGKDVREEQDLLVGERVRHLQRADVGKRHPGVFRLAAGIAAVHVRIAEESRRRIAVQLLRHPGVRVGVVAQRPELLLAEEAMPAGDRERHHHAVADLQARVAAADVHHLAHELVAEDVPLLHGGDVAAVDVQVRAADRGGGNPDDGVARVQNLGVRRRSPPARPPCRSSTPPSCVHSSRRARDFARFEQLLETAEILANHVRRVAAQQECEQRVRRRRREPHTAGAPTSECCVPAGRC